MTTPLVFNHKKYEELRQAYKELLEDNQQLMADNKMLRKKLANLEIKETEKTKCVAQIKVDTEEIVRRIKEEYGITDGWIPCSERLPSDDEDVIVSVLDDHGDTPWKYTTVAWLCNGVWISDNDILCGTVVAWMPLPAPYKGGDTE